MRSIITLIFLLSTINPVFSQTSSKVTGRVDLKKFKANSSDEINTGEIKKETTIPKDEIIGTSSYVDLSIEILPESYNFDNEPIVYNSKGLQTKVINGGEEFLLKFKISNDGTGTAEKIKYTLNASSELDNKKIQNNFTYDILDAPINLEPKKDFIFSAKISANRNLRPSLTKFTISVDDASKAGDKKTTKNIETDFIKRPNIDINTTILSTAKDLEFKNMLDSKVEAKDFIQLRVTIENNGDGPAKNLKVNFLEDEHYSRFRPVGYYNSSVLEIDQLDARESTEVTLVYRINQTDDFSDLASSNGIEYRVSIEEDMLNTRYLSDNFEIFSPELESQSVLVAEYTEVENKSFDEEFITYDDNIFSSPRINPNSYALIISNSNYSRMSNIPSASSDALLIEKYFNRAFGIPYDNIIKKQDLSGGAFRDIIDLDMKNKIIGKSNIQLYVYYAGHGMLDDNGNGLFLPTDANPVSPNLTINSVNQSDFYEKLYNLEEVNKIYVFVDACFSGEPKGRDNDYLNEDVEKKYLSSRGASRESIYSLKEEFKEKINLFSAASKDQTSLSYDYFNKNLNFNINNGLFTTFLASGILVDENGICNSDTNRDGSVSIGELRDYIEVKVSAFSNGTQSPTWSGKNSKEKIL